MAATVISARNLSKSYRLGLTGATSLREEVSRWWRSKRRSNHEPPPDKKEFWALREATFDIQAGEVVGIIGKNGSGKSTLLKLLSRITDPSGGEAFIQGRVASLLEVGTGFHPELTGRENIFLNGTMLGMRRSEIRRKLDEIIAFANVERFVDTPVKRYSSGMYVRLAFAVAAHLEPEILLVDEVLAVGDHSFQNKCLGKMRDVSLNEGRTVLFVSHNMAAVARLCHRSIHLSNGKIVASGPTQEVVAGYLGAYSSTRNNWIRPEDADNGAKVQFISAGLRHEAGSTHAVQQYSSPICVELKCRENDTTALWFVRVSVYDARGNEILCAWDNESIDLQRPVPHRDLTITCTFPGSLLRPGSYQIGFSACELASDRPVVCYEDWGLAFGFEVSPEGYQGKGDAGLIGAPARWQYPESI